MDPSVQKIYDAKTKMLMENTMANNNFDWLNLEAHARNEVVELLMPFRAQMLTFMEETRLLKQRNEEFEHRLNCCEVYCRIETKVKERNLPKKTEDPKDKLKVTAAERRRKK